MQNSVPSPERTQVAGALDQPHHVCPWWIGYLMASPMRRLLNPPAKLLAAHVRQGMTVLEPDTWPAWWGPQAG
jgi:hypothetical protein